MEKLMEPKLNVIKAILVLDNDGKRLIAKYYDDGSGQQQLSDVKSQKEFEKALFTRTYKTNSEIIMLENLTCVFRSNVDLHFYVIGSTNENEIILLTVLNCVFETLNQLLRRNLEKKFLLDYMDYVMLALDEICDSGILMEFDPSSVMQRVCMRGGGADNEAVPLGEQTLYDVFKIAKDQIKSSFK